jgi:pyrroline-5-carboxylate reductase
MTASRGIGFIGGGQMACAIARGLVAAEKFSAEKVYVSDPGGGVLQAEIAGVKVAESNLDLISKVDLLILAVKPHIAPQVAAEIAGKLKESQLLVSVAAGVSLSKLAELFGHDRVVRVMPNTPSLVGEGAAGFACGDGATKEDAKTVQDLLSTVGLAAEVPEGLLDAVTGLSGSGPAFIYVAIESLADAGVEMGLPRKLAQQLAAQMVRGAATMVLETDTHPGELKDRVASPAGTTIAGLGALEAGGLRAALRSAVKTAALRSKEMSQESS